jgi:hypothetical protein
MIYLKKENNSCGNVVELFEIKKYLDKLKFLRIFLVNDKLQLTFLLNRRVDVPF